MEIGQLKLGMVDGKEEFFIEGVDQPSFRERFLIPETVNIDEFLEREKYFISGFRGTGKTSLLRYLLSEIQPNSQQRAISLFKSDMPEEKRIRLSKQTGATFADYDSSKMGIAQDFKSAWTWFLLDTFAHMIKASHELVKEESVRADFLRIMGLHDQAPYRKVLGFLPKLSGANVSINADIPFFQTRLDLDFESERSTTASASFAEVVDLAIEAFSKLNFSENFAIGVDELEVFFISQEQYQRDLCMVRDLVFAVDRLNRIIRAANQRAFIICAIRREVVDAIGPLGQEVTRVVHDRGVSLSWHHAPRSLRHPLIELIRLKLSNHLGAQGEDDVIKRFFDDKIEGEPLDVYLLDRSFYRPRDIMWRLTFAQKAFPRKQKFDSEAFKETENDYSTQLWSEVEYELSATLSPDDISAVTSIFSGINRLFFLSNLREVAERKREFSANVDRFLKRHALADICNMLYSHGALGNDFRTGSTGSVTKNRWIFRGDNVLLVDQRMTLNPAIRKALSAIDARKRGSKGAKDKP